MVIFDKDKVFINWQIVYNIKYKWMKCIKKVIVVVVVNLVVDKDFQEDDVVYYNVFGDVFQMEKDV